MNQSDNLHGSEPFVITLSQSIDRYYSSAAQLCQNMLALKKAILSFNNNWLNTVLDEKLILSQELESAKDHFENLITMHYGQYSRETVQHVKQTYVEIESKWQKLTDIVNQLKSNAADVRRVITAVESYHKELNITYKKPSAKLYKRSK